MQRDGSDITEISAGHSVATGITYGVTIPGIVPAYEEDDARISAGYKRDEWRDLGPIWRAREVAHYRIRQRIQVHIGDAQAEAAERARKGH